MVSAGTSLPPSMPEAQAPHRDQTKQSGTATDLSTTPSGDVARVNEHIQSVISLFLEALQIPESSVVRPTVYLSDAHDTSCCYAVPPEIHIIPGHVGKLDVYGEEVAHWLRSQLRPPKGVSIGTLTDDRQVAVEEFFGYLGNCLVRRVCAGHEVGALGSLVSEPSSPDVIRGRRKFMETLEGDLDTLRGFGTTDQGAELRSLKRNLTFLAKRMESTRASPLEELRTWFELFGERLRKVATSPAALTTGDGVLAKKEAGLYNFLRGFSAVISKVAHGADGDSPMGDAPETTQDAEQFRAYGAIARQFAHSIDTLFQAIETAEQLLEAAHKSLLDHCDGYEAATVFLQRSQNPIEELKTLLTTPCRKVFFKHVFGAHLDAKHRPSSLSQWGEAVRMAMHRLR